MTSVSTPLTIGLSIDEYLDMAFEPECELIGGETRPKPMHNRGHSQMRIWLILLLTRMAGRFRVDTEFLVRIGSDVLIPDICVLQSAEPRLYRRILDEAPLLCVEVISPSQSASEMLADASDTMPALCLIAG